MILDGNPDKSIIKTTLIEGTSKSLFTPLHVAASIEDGMVAISLLIQKGSNVEARDSMGRTPLHLAVQCESINNLITLLFEGKANVMALDQQNKTPLHLAKTSKILDILLIKTKADDFSGQCLLEHIIKNHPESQET